jgi:ribosome-associated protein
MDDEKSKTRLKNDAYELKKIGVEFSKLSTQKLDLLPLPENLKNALLAAKKLKSHGAIRRHAQLIGKLMRAADSDEIITAYEQIIASESAQTAQFHQLEVWRERLINEGRDALTEFISLYQPDDLQKLRQLIKKAVSEQQTQSPAGAGKALFRYLRSCAL